MGEARGSISYEHLLEARATHRGRYTPPGVEVLGHRRPPQNTDLGGQRFVDEAGVVVLLLLETWAAMGCEAWDVGVQVCTAESEASCKT